MIKYDKNSANLIQHYWFAKDGFGYSSDDVAKLWNLCQSILSKMNTVL